MIKKLKLKVTCAIVAFALIIIGTTTAEFITKKEDRLNKYVITAQTDGKKLSGEMNLDYINSNPFDIDNLSFCLYPNAFKNESNVTSVAVEDRINEAYPNGFDAGYINIASVCVDGKKAEYILEENEQILTVFTGTIKKGKDCKIVIEFSEKLPNSPMRYGYFDNTSNFGNWYPVLCPIRDEKAVQSLYTACGDPFFSECADYYVSITAPKEMRIASSGVIVQKEEKDIYNSTWEIKGENIRDFAFCMSRDYKLRSRKVGETLVYSYYVENDEMGEAALEYAVSALNTFNSLFGQYPYETLSVAAADFYIGGMEYPNLVFVSTELYDEPVKTILEEVTVHEVAHQWWYAIVGNNQIAEPWLDEGLTQYSVALYYEEKYGRGMYKHFLKENESYCRIVFDIVEDIYGTAEKRIIRASTDFENWLLYDAVIYDASALMLDSLRESIGRNTYMQGMKKYFEEYKYKTATTDDFINTMNEVSKNDVKKIIDPWLNGSVYWG